MSTPKTAIPTWYHNLSPHDQERYDRAMIDHFKNYNAPLSPNWKGIGQLTFRCPHCGAFVEEGKSLSETGYEARVITTQCTCGRIITSWA